MSYRAIADLTFDLNGNCAFSKWPPFTHICTLLVDTRYLYLDELPVWCFFSYSAL